ncbi:MAG: PsbP-related protein [Bacteroidota bacterium]
MKKIILTLTVCLCLGVSYGQTTNSKTKTKAKTAVKPVASSSLLSYDNKENKIKLQYPKTWELTDTITDAVFYIFAPEEENDQFRENISMSSEDISQSDVSFKEYVEQNLVGIKDGSTILDFKETSSKYFTWNGKPAFEITYTGKVSEVSFPLTWHQRFVFNKGKAYILTYSAEGERKDPYISAVKSLMNSVKFY